MNATPVVDRLIAFAELSQRILQVANLGVSRIEFLRQISRMLIEAAGCDAVEIRLSDGELAYRWQAVERPEPHHAFQLESDPDAARLEPGHPEEDDTSWERLARALLAGRIEPDLPGGTPGGSFLVADTSRPARLPPGLSTTGQPAAVRLDGPYRSVAIHPFVVDPKTVGLLQLKGIAPGAPWLDEIEFYGRIAQTIGLAVANRRAQSRLRERVKELTCLYGIAHVVKQQRPLDDKLQSIVELLPPGWQFPDVAQARIVLDGKSYTTPGYRDGLHTQGAEIRIDGVTRGRVEVTYTDEKPEFAEGPFLREEENLIESIAHELAQLVEGSEAQDERARLAAQLQHADRLATIGQLAAGIAHELNEPLANVLGFAQLLQKAPLPDEALADARKIVDAALHAREVIHKMLLFARKSPPRRVAVNLNELVRDGLSFLESRCAKSDIELWTELADIPEIIADPAQLQQVLMNLAVNAIQAMPHGGKLTVRTAAGADHVALVVADTGTGMTGEVRKRIFDPFFTTKDVGEGTGLGLSVVHGIVTAHGGSIDVRSASGGGSRFEVRLPLRSGPDHQARE